MILGRLEKTAIDRPDPTRPDPRALAAVYAEVLGMEVLEDEPV